MNRLSLLLVLLLLTGGGAAVAQRPQQHAAATASTTASATAAVVGATAVCPDLRQSGTDLQTRVSAGVAAAGAGEAGSLTAEALRSDAQPVRLPVDRPGQVVAGLGAGIDGDAYVVSARGSLAAGLEVEQVTRSAAGSSRGLAGLRCRPPSTDAWFVGGSTKVGASTVLVLANVDDTPAVVDVTTWTGQGPVDARPGRGITVAPRSRQTVPVDTLAPDHDLLALHVSAQRGRVAAAVRHAVFDGRTPGGADWIPQALPPATSVVVAGLPQGPGRRVVQVTNPGLDDTLVELQMTTTQGQFVPTDLDAIAVPAGTTVATDVTPLLADTPAAFRITSDGGPVLAGAFVYDSQGTSAIKELSYAGSGGPLSGPALLTDLVLDRPTESTLLLTAPDADAAVEVAPVPVVGQATALPAPRQVRVQGGRTLALRLSTFLPAGASGRFAVEVRPLDGGPVYAARYLRERGERGPLTTLLELQGAAQRVPLPAVVRDPMAGVSR